MSISMYRSDVARATKDKADLEKRLAHERERMSRLQGDISSLMRSLASSTSASLRQSKQHQLESKQRDVAQCQKAIAEHEKRIADNVSDLHRALQNLQRAEEQEHRRTEQQDRKRRDEALRHVREVTRQTERQVQLQSALRNSRLVIDLARLPLKIKVLFLAANPYDATQLRLDEEIRAITEKIRASEYRDSVELISRWAVRPLDLLQALNEHKPHVVHFSGHGSAAGELIFQGDDGGTKVVPKDAMVATMSTLADSIRVVLFNACFSKEQAEAVTMYVDVAIGMNDAVGDEAARVFAAQFYSAIGFGCSVRQAFDQAVAALMLEGIPEQDTPEIFNREGVDPSEIVLVRPGGTVTPWDRVFR